jgi:hypothetical protein
VYPSRGKANFKEVKKMCKHSWKKDIDRVLRETKHIEDFQGAGLKTVEYDIKVFDEIASGRSCEKCRKTIKYPAPRPVAVFCQQSDGKEWRNSIV